MSDIKITKSTAFYRAHGGVFDDVSIAAGGMHILLTDDEVTVLRDEADRLFPVKRSDSRDINENTLGVLLDIADDFDREIAVKAYLREVGALR